jgi:Fe-Mn family superoxide dismutase
VNANKLPEGTELANEAIETIIKKTAGDTSKQAIFNNVAQVWNHSF